jgi:hypothetical protein
MAPASLPLQRPSPPPLRQAMVALLPLLLGGCSGTPFGEALSRSFPSPSATPGGAAPTSLPAVVTTPREGGAPANPGSPSPGPAGTAGVLPGQAAPAMAGPASAAAAGGAAASSAVVPKPGGSPAPGPGPAGKDAVAAKAVAQRPAAPAPANPSPYRVTIRLPQADPSAPAEVVTEALRAAGVPFAVETIERMGAGTAAAAPAAPPVVPAVPQVRPAPPPR